MPSSRRVAILAIVLLAPAFAGCNLKDWWNYDGTFEVRLAPMGAQNTTLTEFRSLTIAIYGVTLKQVRVIEPASFSFEKEPLLIDFVAKGTKGEKIPLVTTTMKIRAVESVTLHLDVIEAIDLQGRAMPVCREGQPTSQFPCFFMPENGAFRHTDVPFAPPRGGTVVFDYPLGVQSVEARGDKEYFLFEDPALAKIETKR